MRLTDTVGFAFAALGRHKLRTALTTLSVASGTLALVGSLSIGQGVRQAIVGEWSRHDGLRTIDVFPNWQSAPADPPARRAEAPGDMTEARRERLRAALDERRQRKVRAVPQPIDRAALAAIAALDHVEAVTPAVDLGAWLSLEDSPAARQDAEPALATPAFQGRIAAASEPANYATRLVAGNAPATHDEAVVLVGELLVYEWGFHNEADVDKVVGRKLRVEIRTGVSDPGLLMAMFGNPASASRSDERLLARLLKQLPESLDRFDFSADERAALQKLLTVEAAPDPPRQTVAVGEYVIGGVLRLLTPEERDRAARSFGWRDSSELYADVLAPQRTAETLFERSGLGEQGYYRAHVRVDDKEHVRGVLDRLEQMKLEARAPLEFIEREQLQYAMIFHAMACVAVVALAVAAIGIANTMLMSVLERTREIGILKALGARNGDILRMFVVEGALIGLVGGCLGPIVARLAAIPGDASLRAMVLERFEVELHESLFVFPFWIVAGSIAFATLATTLAAIQPARRAARIDPIAALRHE